MKSYRIKNIKSFLDSGTVEIAPLTIFVGQNSCGKSSLLRFPMVLAQTALSTGATPLLFNGKYVDYGFFDNVVHNQKGDTIQYEFSYEVDINDNLDLRYVSSKLEYEKDYETDVRVVKMSIIVGQSERNIVVKSSSIYVDDKLFASFVNEDKDKNISSHIKLYYLIDDKSIKKVNYSFDIDTLSFQDAGFPLYEMGDLFASVYYKIKKVSEKEFNKKEISSEYDRLFLNANPFGQQKLSKTDNKIMRIKNSFDKISTIMSHVYMYYRNESLTMTYIGPFREAPSRIYRDSESSEFATSVGVHGENVGVVLAGDYRKQKRLLNEISKWIEPTLGYKLSIDDMNNGFFQISLVDKHGIHSNLSDVGFGISQVLPIVTQVLSNSRRTVSIWGRSVSTSIYIEQPELHLHPAAQAKLADLFAGCIMGKNNYTNIVLETHSEHLIRRLQVLVSDKNTPLTSEMIKIYYIDKNRQGNAFIRDMRILDNGKFEEEWPTGFFDQAYNLTMDLLRNTAEIL